MRTWRWLGISVLAPCTHQRRPASSDQLVSVPFAAPALLRSGSLAGWRRRGLCGQTWLKVLDPGDDLGGPSPPDQIHGGVVAAMSELADLQPDDRATVVVDIKERRHNRDEIFAAFQLPGGEVKVGFT
jgi:hypothetical protein